MTQSSTPKHDQDDIRMFKIHTHILSLIYVLNFYGGNTLETFDVYNHECCNSPKILFPTIFVPRNVSKSNSNAFFIKITILCINRNHLKGKILLTHIIINQYVCTKDLIKDNPTSNHKRQHTKHMMVSTIQFQLNEK